MRVMGFKQNIQQCVEVITKRLNEKPNMVQKVFVHDGTVYQINVSKLGNEKHVKFTEQALSIKGLFQNLE